MSTTVQKSAGLPSFRVIICFTTYSGFRGSFKLILYNLYDIIYEFKLHHVQKVKMLEYLYYEITMYYLSLETSK